MMNRRELLQSICAVGLSGFSGFTLGKLKAEELLPNGVRRFWSMPAGIFDAREKYSCIFMYKDFSRDLDDPYEDPLPPEDLVEIATDRIRSIVPTPTFPLRTIHFPSGRHNKSDPLGQYGYVGYKYEPEFPLEIVGRVHFTDANTICDVNEESIDPTWRLVHRSKNGKLMWESDHITPSFERPKFPEWADGRIIIG